MLQETASPIRSPIYSYAYTQYDGYYGKPHTNTAPIGVALGHIMHTTRLLNRAAFHPRNPKGISVKMMNRNDVKIWAQVTLL